MINLRETISNYANHKNLDWVEVLTKINKKIIRYIGFYIDLKHHRLSNGNTLEESLQEYFLNRENLLNFLNKNLTQNNFGVSLGKEISQTITTFIEDLKYFSFVQMPDNILIEKGDIDVSIDESYFNSLEEEEEYIEYLRRHQSEFKDGFIMEDSDADSDFLDKLKFIEPLSEINIDAADIQIIVRKSIESINSSSSGKNILLFNHIDIQLYEVLTKNPELIKTLNWRIFEELLADILFTLGYEIELNRGTKDGGVDIFAIKKNGIMGDHRYLLQAKRYKNKVGVAPVRELAFLHSNYKASKSCLVTTSSFTKGAWQLANQNRWQLELKDYVGLFEWIKFAKKLKK